jgi:hypothetical protein
VITLLAVGLLGAGCGRPLAVGTWNEVVVAADPAVWSEVGPDLRRALEREILSVRRETAFRVRAASLEDPDAYRTWAKVIVIASLEGNGPVLEPIPGDVRAAVLEKGALVTILPDVWAKNQWVLFLLTARQEDIPRTVMRSREVLFSRIDEHLRDQVRERMFLSGRDVELEERLRADHRFSLRLPVVYRVDETGLDRGALRFFNIDPQRSIIVSWEEAPRDTLDPGAVLERRRELAELYYPGDRVVEERTTVERVEFHGHRALRLSGVWENREEIEGGTFVTLAFDCPETGRFYLIDALLYSPDPKKSRYVYQIQIETILDSFRCVPLPAGASDDP